MKKKLTTDDINALIEGLKQEYDRLQKQDKFNQMANDSYYLSREQKELDVHMNRVRIQINALRKLKTFMETNDENSFL